MKILVSVAVGATKSGAGQADRGASVA